MPTDLYPPKGSDITVRCVESRAFDRFTVGRVYKGKRESTSRGAIVVDDRGNPTLILLYSCAFGDWNLIEENSEVTKKNKNHIWDTIIQSAQR